MASFDGDIESALGARQGRRHGDEISFLCVAHDDATPSADWNRRKGTWHCMACGAGGPSADLAQRLGIRVETVRERAEKGRIVATYDYQDASGAVIYRKTRFEPKSFMLQRFVDGEWVNGLAGVAPILYQLPALLSADPDAWVLLPEGEKDVQNLQKLGLVATTSPGGANGRDKNGRKAKQKWYPDRFNGPLRGRKVALLQDNDEAGEDFCEFVAHSLKGVAACVRVVALPGLPKKGDVSDWLFQGGTAEELLEIIASTPDWEPVDHPEGVGGFALSDAGNAELFAHLYGDVVRYDHQRGRWLRWDQHRWAPDEDGQIWRWAVLAARERAKAAAEMDGDSAKRVFAWAKASENARSVENMLKHAKATYPLADNGRGWDANPMLIGVTNGVINLTTGQLRDGKPSDRITMSTGIAFDPAATCPRWEQFMTEVFEGETEVIDYIQRAFGYSLTGSTREQVLFLGHGVGANGKSTLMKFLRAVGGDYACNIASDTIKSKNTESHPAEIAQLVGKRIVTCVESTEGGKLHDERIKGLVGGDVQSARFMRGDWFSFLPVLKLWLVTNHLPKVTDDSEGFWRRMRRVPFEREFKGADMDLELDDKLFLELPGILAWAVRGAVEWHRRGLQAPQKVMMATWEYRASSDPLADFISECCVVDGEAMCTAGEIFKRYQAWCEQQGMSRWDMLSNTSFGTRMTERYQKGKMNHGTRIYKGIRVRYDDEPADATRPPAHIPPPPNLDTNPEKNGRVLGDPGIVSHEASSFKNYTENAPNPPPVPPSCDCEERHPGEVACDGAPFWTYDDEMYHCPRCHPRGVAE